MAETNTAKKEKGGFFSNLKVEFKKIVWPDRQSAVRQIVLIIVVTIILGILVNLLDTGIKALIGLIAG